LNEDGNGEQLPPRHWNGPSWQSQKHHVRFLASATRALQKSLMSNIA
jgi:hypothetical protein